VVLTLRPSVACSYKPGIATVAAPDSVARVAATRRFVECTPAIVQPQASGEPVTSINGQPCDSSTECSKLIQPRLIPLPTVHARTAYRLSSRRRAVAKRVRSSG
jgi:hypothetical protein